MITFLKKLFKKQPIDPIQLLREGSDSKHNNLIKERSNVIQYDCIGSPLRLVIMNDGTQQWLDTVQKDDDVVLQWKER